MPFTTRRAWLALSIAALGAPGSAAAAQSNAAEASPPDGTRALTPGALVLPRDHGSHPSLRTEWWYITGHSGHAADGAKASDGPRLGFQLTFFRSRVPETQALRSQFAAHQLLFAHAALTDLSAGKLLHDQRIARAGFGVAEASAADTDVVLSDWSLRRRSSGPSSSYTARTRGDDFSLDLELTTTQPLLLQGDRGVSQKGPAEDNRSLYLTEPQLAVRGIVAVGRERIDIANASARAWLDHEASDAILPTGAVGWDWIGMNLEDGTALTAFQLRRADGSALWAGGSWRKPGANAQIFGPLDLTFRPMRHWMSAASQGRYPVVWSLSTPEGRFEVHALLDAQELDSRASTGAFYWEGLSELRASNGKRLGRGYLEMTGYASRLQL